ncbi:MAG TPA: prepilin-type N-terminal cleavage/methylation domain-containing protein [Tepidisphaeraceae bacterium]|nr:prepilin-type N-terminal cleavage/methylation domain-containing protein [Tepidisphaeraceae bacterium]
MNNVRKAVRKGFSLIELVIVVVIIGIIAAIAIPKMSRGAAGAGDSALKGDLAVMRQALEQYAAEHGGAYPTVANMPAALTGYTNSSGTTGAQGTAGFIYGPYLKAVPPLPVGAATEKGLSTMSATVASGNAWIFTEDSTSTYVIDVHANATTTDVNGTVYNTY